MEHVLHLTPEQVKEKAVKCVTLAKSLVGDKGDVEFSAEHFGDCLENMDFVIDVLKAVVEAGATTINLPNTVERYRPSLYVNQIKQVYEALPKNITISVHCHNDLGMATAATVESFFVGATQLEVALNGLGERCGNTNFYEVAVALHNSGVETGLHMERIYETAILISQWSGISIYSRAPLIGAEAIVHRSGIHQDGASKTKDMKKGAYRPIDYSIIGRHQNDALSFTSQSGRTAVYEIITKFGYKMTLAEAAELQPVLKACSEREGELSAERVLDVFREQLGLLFFFFCSSTLSKGEVSPTLHSGNASTTFVISSPSPLPSAPPSVIPAGFTPNKARELPRTTTLAVSLYCQIISIL